MAYLLGLTSMVTSTSGHRLSTGWTAGGAMVLQNSVVVSRKFSR
jgi:hypothetical protein